MINNISFNQDYLCVSVSSDTAYRIFNCDPFGEFYLSDSRRPNVAQEVIVGTQDSNQDKSKNHPTFLMKLLFSTSLTIIVPQNPQGNRLLKLYNLKMNMKICELTFPANIVDVLMNRRRLCVVLGSGQIFIYDLSCIRLLKVLDVEPVLTFVGDLCSNEASLLAIPLNLIKSLTFTVELSSLLAPSRIRDNSRVEESTPKQESAEISPELIAQSEDVESPSNSGRPPIDRVHLTQLLGKKQGYILVYDTILLEPRLVYKAHDSGISKLRISNNGRHIASASTKGTIIRVFEISEQEEVKQLSHDAGIEVPETPNPNKPILQSFTVSDVLNLRRGHNPAAISCLAFSVDNKILGVALESGKVHIFDLEEPQEENEDMEANGADLSNSDAWLEGNQSSEDLNENLASLLISPSKQIERERSDSGSLYFSSFKNMVKNNHFTQQLVKKLPYKGYLENIWIPPRRNFAYVKLEGDKDQVEIGFLGNTQVVLASYKTCKFYTYNLPAVSKIPTKAILVNETSLCT